MNIRTLAGLALVGAVGLGATACTDGATSLAPETALLSVTPVGGATEVDPASPIEVTFDHAMSDHATDYMAVHEGDVTGPEVAGTWTMEQGGTVMRFMPDTVLMEGTQYTIHLGGGMMDADSGHVDMGSYGMAMGGMWATDSMMAGGMMGGQHGHMGEGWQDPETGNYGMVFTFTTSGMPASQLVAIVPQGGDTAVDPTAPVVVTFNHAVDSMMVDYAALHEGDVTGPVVAGMWSLSDDATRLIFTPDAPLQPATRYTIHLGGDMMDANGDHIDLATNGAHMGGEWATDSMMGGGMMGGGSHEHMGEGWQHPDNGSYGMVFTFVTAG